MNNETARTVPRRQRPLYRDTGDQKIAGVCSGLGHYFDIHTTLVRLAFVVVTLFGGAGVLAYFVLWFALDPAPAGYYPEIQTEADIAEDQTGPAALPQAHPDGPADTVDPVSGETQFAEPDTTEP